MSKHIDLTGKQFGRLTVVEYSFLDKHRYMHYICKCECGNTHTASSNDLRKGDTKSCGCLRKENGIFKHALVKHPLYKVWAAMKQRCVNKKHKSYKDYGGRGIIVCAKWSNDFKAFYDWAMANGYQKGLEIDRRENDGNYEPGNCRWVTKRINLRNKSNLKLNEAMVSEIRYLFGTGMFTRKMLATMFHVSKSNLRSIVFNEAWKELSQQSP